MTRFRVRFRSSKVWQWCLVDDKDKFIVPWIGQFRGPGGKDKCVAEIDLVRRTNALTPIEFNVLSH